MLESNQPVSLLEGDPHMFVYRQCKLPLFWTHRYQISISSWSKQLPTLVLFRGGKEVRRKPEIDIGGNVVKKFVMSEVSFHWKMYDVCVLIVGGLQKRFS